MGRDVSFEDSFSDDGASECGKVRPTDQRSTSPKALIAYRIVFRIQYIPWDHHSSPTSLPMFSSSQWLLVTLQILKQPISFWLLTAKILELFFVSFLITGVLFWLRETLILLSSHQQRWGKCFVIYCLLIRWSQIFKLIFSLKFFWQLNPICREMLWLVPSAPWHTISNCADLNGFTVSEVSRQMLVLYLC